MKSASARSWLKANGYDDVCAMIDEIQAEWDKEGSSERRDWFRVCAGGPGGRPRVVKGRAFPVIRAFQIRQGLPVTPNAIWLNSKEIAPPVERKGRWATRRTRSEKIKSKANPSRKSRQ